MNDSYLISLYEEMEKTQGEETYKHIQELFQQAEQLHIEYLDEHSPETDRGQSWRSVKGKNFERLIQHIVEKSLEDLGVTVINGNHLQSTQLSPELNAVKKNIEINYPGFGTLLPDADIVIYKPENSHIIATISNTTSLRERFVQTTYWKLKLLAAEKTAPIEVYLVTPDTDNNLIRKELAKKQRAILETDLDGTYVLTAEPLEESNNVKLFEHFISDLKALIQDTR